MLLKSEAFFARACAGSASCHPRPVGSGAQESEADILEQIRKQMGWFLVSTQDAGVIFLLAEDVRLTLSSRLS